MLKWKPINRTQRLASIFAISKTIMPTTYQNSKPEETIESNANQSNNRMAYFVGSRIASLVGAVFLIRDDLILGESIHIFDELKVISPPRSAFRSLNTDLLG